MRAWTQVMSTAFARTALRRGSIVRSSWASASHGRVMWSDVRSTNTKSGMAALSSSDSGTVVTCKGGVSHLQGVSHWQEEKRISRVGFGGWTCEVNAVNICFASNALLRFTETPGKHIPTLLCTKYVTNCSCSSELQVSGCGASIT